MFPPSTLAPRTASPSPRTSHKTLGHDANNGVQHTVEPLRLPDDLRIALESPLPQLVTDYRHGMRVASHVFSGLESTPKNRVDADGIKIVRRYNAPRGALGAAADAESRAHNLAHKKCVKQRAISLQISKIWPRNSSMARLAARRSGEGKQLLLVGYGRVRTE